MSLVTTLLPTLKTGAPHTRGDEPVKDKIVERKGMCSPHTWG